MEQSWINKEYKSCSHLIRTSRQRSANSCCLQDAMFPLSNRFILLFIVSFQTPTNVQTIPASTPTPAEIWLEDTSASASRVGRARTATPVSTTLQQHNNLCNEEETGRSRAQHSTNSNNNHFYLYMKLFQKAFDLKLSLIVYLHTKPAERSCGSFSSFYLKENCNWNLNQAH